MDRDAAAVRQGRPVIFSSLRDDPRAAAVAEWALAALAEHAHAAAERGRGDIPADADPAGSDAKNAPV
jgi:urease accessory protein